MVKRKSRPQIPERVVAKAIVGMKIPRWKHRAGSTPAPGTIFENNTLNIYQLDLIHGSRYP